MTRLSYGKHAGHAFAFALLTLAPLTHAQTQCAMSHAFDQTDVDAPGGKTPVWKDEQGNLMFVQPLHINTDGTRRSYNIDDFWGTERALNNVCNAMKDLCAGLDKPGMQRRRELTQRAHKEGWPKDLLDESKLSPKIIPMPGGRPCKSIDGYLVSATALRKPRISDQCDLTNYVDALTVPALVIPENPEKGLSEFAKRDIKVGELVVAMSGQRTVRGVVGDTGPTSKLGEATLAMNGQLLGKTEEPKNYDQVRGNAPYHGQGWGVRSAFVLIFAGSRDKTNPYMTVERIDPEVDRRFDQWGGTARAQACIDQYKSAQTKRATPSKEAKP